MTEAERNMHAALNAIYLEVPAEIAQDINEKVRLRVQELEAALKPFAEVEAGYLQIPAEAFARARQAVG